MHKLQHSVSWRHRWHHGSAGSFSRSWPSAWLAPRSVTGLCMPRRWRPNARSLTVRAEGLPESSQLTEQFDGADVFSGSKCGDSANDERCHRAQQFAELTCRPRIEPAIGAVRHLGDVSEHLLDLAIVPLLEYEGRHLETSELARFVDECVRILLHGIADKDQGAHRKELGLLPDVGQHLLDLCLAGVAHDA